MRSRTCRSFLLALSALVLLVLPVAAAAENAYMDAVVTGIVTDDGSNVNSFTLPAGDSFPQITSPDSIYGLDVTCHAVTGVEVNFLLAVGVDAFEGMEGNMRLTLIYNDEEAALLLGTFSLELHGDPSDYVVTGTVAGDAYALYLAGTDTMGTPDAGDDRPFLMRINGYAPNFLMYVDDVFFGTAGILVGDPLVRGLNDALGVNRVTPGAQLDLGSFSAPFTFNQVTPPDGGGDLAVGSDSTAAFWTASSYSGSIAGTGAEPLSASIQMDLYALALTSGPSADAALTLGKFEARADDGRYFQGLMLADAASPDATGVPIDGYIFSLAAAQGAANEYFFGTFNGYMDGPGPDYWTHLGIDVDGGFWSVDSAPPGQVFLDYDGPLMAGTLNDVGSIFRDMNGATDIKTVLLAVGTSRTNRKLQAKYDHRRGRLYLYNSRLKKWVGGCQPGAPGIIRTPHGRLSCADTFVDSLGEYLFISWSLMPTNRMVGTWNGFTKVVDRTKLVEGWKMLMDPVEIASP